MMHADQVRDMLREQDDYFHDATVIASATRLLRFQLAKALRDLRRERVLVVKRVPRRKVGYPGERRSELVYTVEAR